MVAARRDHIRTIRESRLVRIERGDVGEDEKHRGLICNNALSDFRAMQLDGTVMQSDRVICSDKQIEILRVNEGDTVRVWTQDNG